MDTTDILKMSGLSAGTITIVLIVYRAIKYVKGKKLVSSCCGHKGEIGFDVREMEGSPPRVEPDIKIPASVENVRQNQQGDKTKEGDHQGDRGAFELGGVSSCPRTVSENQV